MYIQRWIKRDRRWITVADITRQIAGPWRVLWRTGVATATYQTLDALRAVHDVANVQRVVDPYC